jgi:hypothetical protein
LAGALCACLLALAVSTPAFGAAGENPTFVFFPPEAVPGSNPPIEGVPPGTGIHDACGLGVDPAGNFYVSDYYHDAVDLFRNTPDYLGTRLSDVDPLGSPCGLAIDSTGKLYVNDYHRSVIRYTPSSFPASSVTAFEKPMVIDANHSTGVAASLTSGNVYVDDGTYVAVYNSAGTLLYEVGHDSSADYFGVAVSRYIQTSGYVYVPDASTNTVKVFDPAVSKLTPVATITGPPAGFADLRDSAIAVTSNSGDVYISDRVGSRLSEHPEAAVYVFDHTGAYKGRLKYNVVDPGPVGLGVDNSTGINQGRVYVTSGNSEHSSIYAYPPGAATNVEEPAVFSLSVKADGSGNGVVTSTPSGIHCTGNCEADFEAGGEIPLRATPAQGSSFAGWSGGGCSATGICTVEMSEAASVEAEFVADAKGDPAPAQSSDPPVAGGSPTSEGAAAENVIRPRPSKRHGHRRARHRHRAAHLP